MRLAATIACGILCGVCGAYAHEAVTIDDLVRRTQIPLAAISPDGRYAAYLFLRGDAVRDNYEATVNVSDLRVDAPALILSTYTLTPAEAFDGSGDFAPSAGELHWTLNDDLIFLSKSDCKMRLLSWNAQARRVRTLFDGHDRIVLDAGAATENIASVSVTDFEHRSPPPGSQVADTGWRIQDGYRFFGPLPFKNPTTGRWQRSQKFTISFEPNSQIVPDREPMESWESIPREWQHHEPPVSDDSVTYRHGEMVSPDGTRIAVIEDGAFNLKQPDKSFWTSRVIVQHGGDSKVLIPFARPRSTYTILGWEANSRNFFYVNVGATDSVVNRATVAGKVSVVHRDTGELEVPGASYGRRCQVLSRNGDVAILARSTNVMPAELIEIELANGRVSVISSPNDVFLKNAQPRVRFYPIEMTGQDVYGRLYLPLHYREATRYPIVFTQYYSGPGFVAATGDEVPIIPMAADDIAVFALQSSQLDLGLANGDFRLEISRLSKPLEAMEWVVRKLDAEGLVDRERVAVTGLSYGAESAMYGYWRSRLFRAVSVASASWDPTLMPFGGLTYEKFLEQRGFPFSYDQSSIRRWRDLSAGLNARATLPPLLLQSSDAEENITVPTWFQLRRAGAPVEWYEYPNEGHVKESPADKWWIYQRNLDWFRFWLKDEEDPSPTKAEQYQRWRKMRADWEAAKKSNSSSVLHDGTRRPPEASGTRRSTER